jgi:hypothetical protein
MSSICPQIVRSAITELSNRTRKPKIRSGVSQAQAERIATNAIKAAQQLAGSAQTAGAQNNRQYWENVARDTQKALAVLERLQATLGSDGFERFEEPVGLGSFFPTSVGQQPKIFSRHFRITTIEPTESTPSNLEIENMISKMRSANIYANKMKQTAIKNIINYPDFQKDAFVKILLEFYIYLTGTIPGKSLDHAKSPFLRLICALWDSAGYTDVDFSSNLRRLWKDHYWLKLEREISLNSSFILQWIEQRPSWLRGD